jgi:hypothetical protein
LQNVIWVGGSSIIDAVGIRGREMGLFEEIPKEGEVRELLGSEICNREIPAFVHHLLYWSMINFEKTIA